MNLFYRAKLFSRREKILLGAILLIFVLGWLGVGWLFYLTNSEKVASGGGTYLEGMVGKVNLINPLFADYNPVDQDLASLIFAGLTKYDLEQKKIVPDLAHYEVDQKLTTYTFTLKDNLKWHDGAPLTTDDIIFTYQSLIQNPDFPNAFLKANFREIEIKKINDKQISFKLKKPYYFFPTLTTMGLLPKHLWEKIPLDKIISASLNTQPIGCGPYKIKEPLQFNETTGVYEVYLEAFKDYHGPAPKIKNIVLKIIPDVNTALTLRHSVDAFKNLPPEFIPEFSQNKHFQIIPYSLPQYIAVFINTESPKLREAKTRLALQLATPKTEILKQLPHNQQIDTPFLELKKQEWSYQFDLEKSRGALYDTGWQLPKNDASKTGQPAELKPVASPAYRITEPNNGEDLITTENTLILRGTVPPETRAIFINDYKLTKYKASNPTWSYIASTKFNTLLNGENNYKISYEDKEGKRQSLDQIKITLAGASVGSQVTTANQNQNSTTSFLDKADYDYIRFKGTEPLVLSLLTVSSPPEYQIIAETFKKSWREIGVKLNVSILDTGAFEQKIKNQNYDLLLFGQSLGYNFDTFPYWHSSQSDGHGLNLSNYKSFRVDALLEEIRNPYGLVNIFTSEAIETFRQEKLQELGKLFQESVPAIFISRPVYYFVVDDRLKNISMENLVLPKDRFSNLDKWYIKETRHLKVDFSLATLWNWWKQELGI